MRTVALAAFFLLALAGPAPAAEVVTVAGTGRDGHAGDGGPALEADVGGPFGLVIGPDGALYVCETTGHAVRRIDAETGRISTVAGTGEKGCDGDGGPATAARLDEPYEARFDRDGNLYFVEMRDHVVRRVDARTGTIGTASSKARTNTAVGTRGPGAVSSG